MSTWQIIGIILMSACITVLLRALPFLIFNGNKTLPKPVQTLGRYLPPADYGSADRVLPEGCERRFLRDGRLAASGSSRCGSQLQMEAQYIFEYPAWNSLLYGVSADFLVRA